MAADRQWVHSSAPKTNSCVQPALLRWTEGGRSGRARFPWSGFCLWREKSVGPRGSFESCRRGQNKATKAKIALRERCTSSVKVSMSVVFIFPLTPGLEEPVVNRLYSCSSCRGGSCLDMAQFFVWNRMSWCCSGVYIRKKARQYAILTIINTPILLDLWVTGTVSTAAGSSECCGLTRYDNSDFPNRPVTRLSCKQGYGLSQALCQPGERSKVIVICDTMLKGAAVKSAVIMECRPSNEAPAFTLLFIVCRSGTLCSLFTDH